MAKASAMVKTANAEESPGRLLRLSILSICLASGWREIARKAEIPTMIRPPAALIMKNPAAKAIKTSQKRTNVFVSISIVRDIYSFVWLYHWCFKILPETGLIGV